VTAPDHPTRADRGSVTIWTVVVTAACIATVGLVLDGGAVLRARSDAFGLAGAAARAGAQELDQVALTEGRVVVDAAAARRAAAAYLGAHDAAGDVVVRDRTVTVTVRRRVTLQILSPATVGVNETATVRAASGRS
jgi:putative Flp pilus-assembly TadE/G-like protein